MAEGAVISTDFSLVHTISPYLEPQLVLLLLDFLLQKNFYDSQDILLAKRDILRQTKRVDCFLEAHNSLNTGAHESGIDKESVNSQLSALEQQCKSLVDIIRNSDLITRLVSEKLFTPSHLEEHNVTQENIKALYTFAKFQFDCGSFETASELLHFFRLLDSSSESSFAALWGKLAADIFIGMNGNKDMEAAYEDIRSLFAAIETRPSSLEQLQQRSWLCHWALFAHFGPGGVDPLASLARFFSQEKIVNMVQTNCPWLLRYWAVSVVAAGRSEGALNELTQILLLERGAYSDPITEFVLGVYSDFDFDTAFARLDACVKVLDGDFFLCRVREHFLEGARKLIFETYCRVHQSVDISLLSSRLGVDAAGAERWLVDLVRGADLDAKIDADAGRALMVGRYSSIHQQVVERTKDLALRSLLLSASLEQRAKDAAAAAAMEQRAKEAATAAALEQQAKEAAAVAALG